MPTSCGRCSRLPAADRNPAAAPLPAEDHRHCGPRLERATAAGGRGGCAGAGLLGDLLRAPRRVGQELQRELLGTWSARRGSYRILYEIHDVPEVPGEASEEAGFVRVVDVDHRRDVYRRR